MPITNETGQVAIRYYSPSPKYIRLSNGHEYVFSGGKYVSASWVNEEDVSSVLSLTRSCNCSGGSKKPMFREATQQEVNLWLGVGDAHPS